MGGDGGGGGGSAGMGHVRLEGSSRRSMLLQSDNYRATLIVHLANQ